MTHHTAAPLWEQILILLFAPPILSCIFWAMSRGWAQTVQGADVSWQYSSLVGGFIEGSKIVISRKAL